MTDSPSRWGSAARTAALILLASTGAYLLSLVSVSWLAYRVARGLQDLSHPWLKLLLGVVLLDLGKLVGLLPAAWLIARRIALRPILAAAALVLLCFAIELAVMATIGQADWVLQTPAILATRCCVAALMVWPVHRMLAHR